MLKKFRAFTLSLIFASISTSVWAFDATVVAVSGKVEKKEGNSWIALNKGDKITQGTVISTGFESNLVFTAKGSTVTVGPLTRLTVEQLVSTPKKDSSQLYIDSGKVSAEVNSAGGKQTGFKVKSPVATASVRGTEFSVNSAGKLVVKKGLVSFTPAESDKPVIADDKDEEVAETNSNADETRADASVRVPKTTALTSAAEVGDDGGIPVAAGQQSQANGLTGVRSSPQKEKAAASSGTPNNTKAASALEAVSTVSAAAPARTQSTVESVSDRTTRGSLSITIKFEE